MESAAAPSSAKPQKPSDFTNFNFVPSPQAPKGVMATAPMQRHTILSWRC
jgi:hypothetical protein